MEEFQCFLIFYTIVIQIVMKCFSINHEKLKYVFIFFNKINLEDLKKHITFAQKIN